MRVMRQCCRMTIHLCENARVGRRSLADVLLGDARDAGLAGATILRGIEGFGRDGQLHTSHFRDHSGHLPIALVVIDEEEKVRAFLRASEAAVGGRLVTLERVEVVRREPAAAP